MDTLWSDEQGQLFAIADTYSGRKILQINVETGTTQALCGIDSTVFVEEYVVISQCFYWKGIIYVSVMPNGWEALSTLYAFDTTTGAGRLIGQYNTISLALNKDGMILGITDEFSRMELIQIDPSTSQSSVLSILPVGTSNLYCDANTEQIAYYGSPIVYLKKTDEKPVPATYLPTALWMNRSKATILGNVYIICEGSILRYATVDAAIALDESAFLNIASSGMDLPLYADFRQARPDIPLRSYDLSTTPADIAQTIRSGESDIDLFMTYQFVAGYSELLTKGFCYDLSASESITGRIGEMYPKLASSLVADGKPVAYPMEVFVNPFFTLSYLPDALEKTRLLPQNLPTNLNDWLTQMIALHEAGDMDDLRLFDGSNSEQSEQVLSFVVESYAAYYAAENEPIEYNSSLFTTLMEKTDKLIQLINSSPEKPGDASILFEITAAPLYANSSNFTPLIFLPLSLDEGLPLRLTVSMAVFIINPLSERKEAALEFVSFAAEQNSSALDEMMLFQSMDEPVESPYYASTIERYENERELLNSAMKKALSDKDDFAIQMYKEQLTQLEAEIAYADFMRWEVSPELLAQYKLYGDSFYTMKSIFSEIFDYAEARQLYDRYLSGEMSWQQFQTALHQRAQRVQHE